jgi:hypothetical protein
VRVEVLQQQQQDGVERATAEYVCYRRAFVERAVVENEGWLQRRRLGYREKGGGSGLDGENGYVSGVGECPAWA